MTSKFPLSPTFLITPSLSAAEPAALFDDTSLAGWKGTAEWWRLEDGAITGEAKAAAPLSHNEWIYWQGEVRDGEVELEYRSASPPTPSGRRRGRREGEAAGRSE